MAKVSFLGLGVMGFPMAGHLAHKGHEVTVYNRTSHKALEWEKKFHGLQAPTPALASQEAEFVFCCVGNDDDLRSVTLGPDGAFHTMRPGTVFVDHTTTSADVARELSAKASALGFAFLDAPVSGGQSGAEQGRLTVMIGGGAESFKKSEPIIRAYAQTVEHIGVSGSGQLAKMVNQICIAGVVQGLSEALSFALKAKLDIPKVLSAISKGGAASWQMDNRAKTMTENHFDFGFAVDWMRKDLGFCLKEAERNGATLEVTALIDSFYAELQKAGYGRLDTSSLIKRLI